MACCRFVSSSTPRYCNCAGGGLSSRFWRPRIRVTVLSVRCEKPVRLLGSLLRILQSCRGRLGILRSFDSSFVCLLKFRRALLGCCLCLCLSFPVRIVNHFLLVGELAWLLSICVCEEVLFSCFICISSPDCANALLSLLVGFSI